MFQIARFLSLSQTVRMVYGLVSHPSYDHKMIIPVCASCPHNFQPLDVFDAR